MCGWKGSRCVPVVRRHDPLAAGESTHVAGVAVHVPIAAAHRAVPVRPRTALRAHL